MPPFSKFAGKCVAICIAWWVYVVVFVTSFPRFHGKCHAITNGTKASGRETPSTDHQNKGDIGRGRKTRVERDRSGISSDGLFRPRTRTKLRVRGMITTVERQERIGLDLTDHSSGGFFLAHPRMSSSPPLHLSRSVAMLPCCHAAMLPRRPPSLSVSLSSLPCMVRVMHSRR